MDMHQGGLAGLVAIVDRLATDDNVLDPACVPYLEVHNVSQN